MGDIWYWVLGINIRFWLFGVWILNKFKNNNNNNFVKEFFKEVNVDDNFVDLIWLVSLERENYKWLDFVFVNI